MAVKHIPAGYHSVTPYLIVNDAERALDYYKKAFGASEVFRMDAPGGKVGHAEIQIGDLARDARRREPGIGERRRRRRASVPRCS